MKYVLTNSQMREADKYTIEVKGVPSLTLMERAGAALADKAQQIVKGGDVLCVCGGGNNGGDGFICARILRSLGYSVDVVCVAERFSADCERAKENYLQGGGRIENEFLQKTYSLVVDALLGTGFKGELSPVYASAIKRINEYKKGGAKVLSADIPSGVNGDNGCVESVAVQADFTLCIGEYKTGVYLGEGIDCAGEISCVDIGIALPKADYAQVIDEEKIISILPKRKRNSHKGSYGRAAIVAGSMSYTGAAYLATAACLRSGAGYTTLFTPMGLIPHFLLRLPEALLQPLCGGSTPTFNEAYFERLLSYDSIAFGMGMGATKEVAKGVKYLLHKYEGKLVLDADALNALALHTKAEKVLKNKKCDVVLTPHVKEFCRLSQISVDELIHNPLELANEFALASGAAVYLKNAVSVATDGKKTLINVTGNSGQAKGGSGDVLSGVIAGLCAQGVSAYEGACIGGYIVGKAAELASQENGERAVIASDIIHCLGKAFLTVES